MPPVRSTIPPLLSFELLSFAAADEAVEVLGRPQHEQPPREAQEEVKAVDGLLLEGLVRLVDAHFAVSAGTRTQIFQ